MKTVTRKVLSVFLATALFASVFSVGLHASAADDGTLREIVKTWIGADFLDESVEVYQDREIFMPYQDSMGWQAGTGTGATVKGMPANGLQQGQKIRMTARITVDETTLPQDVADTTELFALDIVETAVENNVTVDVAHNPKAVTLADYKAAPVVESDLGFSYHEIVYEFTVENAANYDLRVYNRDVCTFIVHGVKNEDISGENPAYLQEWANDVIPWVLHEDAETGGKLVLSPIETSGVVTYSGQLNQAWGRLEGPTTVHTTSGLNDVLLVGVKQYLEPGMYDVEYTVRTQGAMTEDLLNFRIHDPAGKIVDSYVYKNADVFAAFNQQNANVPYNIIKRSFEVTEAGEYRFSVSVPYDASDIYLHRIDILTAGDMANAAATLNAAIEAIGEVTAENYTEKEGLIRNAESLYESFVALYGEENAAAEITGKATLDAARAAYDGFKLEAEKTADVAAIIAKIDEYFKDVEVTEENYPELKRKLNEVNRTIASMSEKYGNEVKELITNIDLLDKIVEPQPPVEIIYGDLNGDEEVDPSDALVVLNAYVGNETLTDEQKTAADVDLSGKIDPTDALLILQKYVDIVEELPVSEEN